MQNNSHSIWRDSAVVSWFVMVKQSDVHLFSKLNVITMSDVSDELKLQGW